MFKWLGTIFSLGAPGFSSPVSLFVRDCHRLVLILGNYVLKILSGYLAFEFLTYTFCNYYFKVSFVVVVGYHP